MRLVKLSNRLTVNFDAVSNIAADRYGDSGEELATIYFSGNDDKMDVIGDELAALVFFLECNAEDFSDVTNVTP